MQDMNGIALAPSPLVLGMSPRSEQSTGSVPKPAPAAKSNAAAKSRAAKDLQVPKTSPRSSRSNTKESASSNESEGIPLAAFDRESSIESTRSNASSASARSRTGGDSSIAKPSPRARSQDVSSGTRRHKHPTDTSTISLDFKAPEGSTGTAIAIGTKAHLTIFDWAAPEKPCHAVVDASELKCLIDANQQNTKSHQQQRNIDGCLRIGMLTMETRGEYALPFASEFNALWHLLGIDLIVGGTDAVDSLSVDSIDRSVRKQGARNVVSKAEALYHKYIKAENLMAQAEQLLIISVASGMMHEKSKADDAALKAIRIYVKLEMIPEAVQAKLCQQLAAAQGSSANRTVADMFSSMSYAANIVFFCGGMQSFESRIYQMIYDVLFVISFVACLIGCFVNAVHGQAPPYHNTHTDFVTIWLHVVGLHMWLFWRGFVSQEQVKSFVRSFVADTKWYPAVQLRVQVIFTFFVLLQLVLIAVAFLALPQPAFNYYEKDPVAAGAQPLIHAIVMWMVIPQHVPTILSCIGLFYVMSILHTMDATRMKDIVSDSSVSFSVDDDVTEIRDKYSTLVEATQSRLDYSCSRWQLMWIHSVVYGILALIVAIVNLRAFLDDEVTFDTEQVSSLLLVTFHFLLGAFSILSFVGPPLVITHVFRSTIKKTSQPLRERGLPSSEVAGAVTYARAHANGFGVLGMSVSIDVIAKLLFAVVLVVPLYFTK